MYGGILVGGGVEAGSQGNPLKEIFSGQLRASVHWPIAIPLFSFPTAIIAAVW